MGVFVLRSLDLPPTLKQATLRPRVKSQVSEKVANGNPQCFRNSQKRVEADPLFTALNLAHVNRMQLSLFR